MAEEALLALARVRAGGLLAGGELRDADARQRRVACVQEGVAVAPTGEGLCVGACQRSRSGTQALRFAIAGFLAVVSQGAGGRGLTGLSSLEALSLLAGESLSERKAVGVFFARRGAGAEWWRGEALAANSVGRPAGRHHCLRLAC